MATEVHITLEDLRRELESALSPIKADVATLKADVKHLQMRTNQMYDALAENGLSLPLRTDQ